MNHSHPFTSELGFTQDVCSKPMSKTIPSYRKLFKMGPASNGIQTDRQPWHNLSFDRPPLSSLDRKPSLR